MADVIAAVDATTGAFGPLVQNRLHSDMQSAINAGVTATIAGMGDVIDAVTDALVPLTTLNAIRALSTNGRNAFTGWFHVDDFGAVGNGTTEDQAAIQAAINAANTAYNSTGVMQRVFFSAKVYSCFPIVNVNPVQVLNLKSGVELYGGGTAVIRVAPASYYVGTDYALLRSPSAGITNAAITDITFDGNRAAFNVPGDTSQCNNITLTTCKNVRLSGVKSIHAAGGGIMVAGAISDPSRDVTIENCTVYDSGNIGIQASQFNGLNIRGNLVHDCTGNGIDVYGENNGSSSSNGINWSISDNEVYGCSVGVFPETVANGMVQNNNIHNCGEGIHINRINATPNDILVSGNHISGCITGIGGTGDMVDITIQGNTLFYFNTGGIILGGGGGQTRISGWTIVDNRMNGVSDSTPLLTIVQGTNQAVNIIFARTITRSTQRQFDYINGATTSANLTLLSAHKAGDSVV